MKTSNHYVEERIKREQLIARIGEGQVVYTTVVYHEKKHRHFRYEITDNGILIVKAFDEDIIITKMIARPNRLKQYWADCPTEIIMIAVDHVRKGYIF